MSGDFGILIGGTILVLICFILSIYSKIHALQDGYITFSIASIAYLILTVIGWIKIIQDKELKNN